MATRLAPRSSENQPWSTQASERGGLSLMSASTLARSSSIGQAEWFGASRPSASTEPPRWVCVGTELFTVRNGSITEVEVHGRPVDLRGDGSISRWLFVYANLPASMLDQALPECILDFADDHGELHRSFRWSGPPTDPHDRFCLARSSNGRATGTTLRAHMALDLWRRQTGSLSIPGL